MRNIVVDTELLADRIGVNEILTIDRGDFDTYRLPGGRRFVQVLEQS